MSNTEIYLLTTLFPNLTGLSMCIMTLSFTALFINFVYVYQDSDTPKYYKRIGAVLALSVILAVLIPTSKNGEIIIGMSCLEQTENVEKLPDNAVKYLNNFLEDNSNNNK